MKKDIIIFSITIIIIIVMVAGTYLYTRENKENNEDIDPIDWCIPGINLTVATEESLSIEDQNMTDDINFQVINLTTYKGKEVCQAEYNYGEGVLIQYFTRNNDQIFFVYKNLSGDDVNEIEINQSSFDTDYENTVYDDINQEEN